MKINDKDVRTFNGRILIDGIRFREWILERRQCPFCEANLEDTGRYTCNCKGWRELKSVTAPGNRHTTQLQLI